MSYTPNQEKLNVDSSGNLLLPGDPTQSNEPATKNYTDTNLATKLNLSGGTMSGNISFPSGSGVLAAGGLVAGNLINVRTLSSGSGSYVPTAGTRLIAVEIIGAGGGGSGGNPGLGINYGVGGGGGGGAYCYALFRGISGSTFTYSIGAGGAGGSGAAGGAGGNTTFTLGGFTLTAGGGATGSSNSGLFAAATSGAAGGSFTTSGSAPSSYVNVLNAGGMTGGDGFVASSSGSTNVYTGITSCGGANLRFCLNRIDAQATTTSGTVNGSTGWVRGVGGSGGLCSNGGAYNGGGGNTGLITIWEYA